MNFGELKGAIAAYLHRTDLATETTDYFIKQVEADVRRDVRMRQQETTTTLSLVTRTVAVPSDFLAVKRIVLDVNTSHALDYLSPDRLYSSRIYKDSGQPSAYTIEGDNFVFAPEPADSPDALLSYYAAFTAFSADIDTNALSDNYPSVYIYGALKHAYIFIQDAELITRYATAYNEEVAKANQEAKASRLGKRLRRTGMTVA